MIWEEVMLLPTAEQLRRRKRNALKVKMMRRRRPRTRRQIPPRLLDLLPAAPQLRPQHPDTKFKIKVSSFALLSLLLFFSFL